MIVKQILIDCAMQLGLDGVAEYLINGASENSTYDEREARSLLRCFNLVETETANASFGIKRVERIDAAQGIVEYSSLEREPLQILRVRDEYGNKLSFTAYTGYFKTGRGDITVTYCCAPIKKELNEESELPEVYRAVLTYGVICEYLIVSGSFDNASAWDKRYYEALRSVCKSKRGAQIKARRWV